MKKMIKPIYKRIIRIIGVEKLAARVATYHDVVVPHENMKEGAFYVKCLTRRDKSLVRYISLCHIVEGH